MTPADFTAWRARLAMTQAQAAAALGYSVRAVAYWEHGEWPLPLSVPLACKTIERNRQPLKPAPRQGPRMSALRDTTRPRWVRLAAASGLIGGDQAAMFLAFIEMQDTIIDIKQVIADPLGCPVPDEKKMDQVYATALTCSGNMNEKNAGKIHQYLQRLPTVFLVMAWQLALQRDTKQAAKENRTGKLRTCPAYMEFAAKYASAFVDK